MAIVNRPLAQSNCYTQAATRSESTRKLKKCEEKRKLAALVAKGDSWRPVVERFEISIE